VKETLTRAREWVNAGATIDVYLTASPYRGEAPSVVALRELNPDSIMYYGGQDSVELLAQFESLRAGKTYAAVLVLSDDSGYELGDGKRAVPALPMPVWLLHFGNLPLGYDDNTLAAIQASGGGVVSTLNEAFVRMNAARNAGAGVVADVTDGYVWTVARTSAAATIQGDAKLVAANDPFAAIAARRLILAEMQRQRGKISDNALLDQLHKIAQQQSIVTPYSSMIVLVNAQQQQRLDELEKRDDRFQREKEAVGETTPENLPVVTGVPEPHEWLLMGMAVVMLVWYMYKSQRVRRA
jgi:putative PEP-CTERM system integral membrane protein